MNLITAITVGITVTQCSVLSFAPRSAVLGRIVGGHAAKPHSHPYMVSLQLRFLWARAHICGGSLLNERWVVTAGHCVTDSFLIRWLNMDAVAGAHDVDRFGPDVQINQISLRIPHPNYMGGIGANDIAVLRTSTPFTFTSTVQPIRLPSAVDLSRDELMLSGWGALKTTFFIPVLPSQLQELDVTYVPFEECFRQMVDFLETDETNPLEEDVHICTGPLGGGKAACNGDSGGPLVVYQTNINTESEATTTNAAANENSEIRTIDDEKENELGSSKVEKLKSKRESSTPTLVGVVSWGISPCGEKGAPTVYTNVSHYMDFINSYIHT